MFLKTKLSFLIMSAGFFSLSCWAETSSNPKEYPGAQKPSCLTQSPVANHSEAYQKGVMQAQEALKKPFSAIEGIWDQEILKKRLHLREAIQEFMDGKRGASVLKINLAGQKPEDLHKKLLELGFSHERVKLPAYSNDKGRKFWRRDGIKTSDIQDPEIVPMDIYTHPDGGMIRVKPEGIPSPKHPHPEPEASKSVAYNLKPREDQVPSQGKMLDTRYRNEAFKVSATGLPVPKGPTPKVGMRFIMKREDLPKAKDPEAARDELKGWISTIMESFHTKLAADFNHCPKNEILPVPVKNSKEQG